jgi:hypothetical protein
MIFKGILPEAIAGGVVKAVTPQEGGSTEMSGALGRLIAQNPEILEVLRKQQPVDSNIEDMPRPEFDIQDFEVIPGQSVMDMAPDAGTLIRLADGTEMRVGFFGEHTPLQQAYLNALQERRAAATPSPAPTAPAPVPTPVVENPFQRPTEAPPVARALPMPEPNRVAAGPALTQMEMSSPFFQGQQPNVALTPAEVLAMARNPFNRPR